MKRGGGQQGSGRKGRVCVDAFCSRGSLPFSRRRSSTERSLAQVAVKLVPTRDSFLAKLQTPDVEGDLKKLVVQIGPLLDEIDKFLVSLIVHCCSDSLPALDPSIPAFIRSLLLVRSKRPEA